MKLKDYPEKLRPFIFHGVSIDDIGDKLSKGDCPFCDKEGHMFINTKTGQWSCKRCGMGAAKGSGGNIPGFLQHLHTTSLEMQKESNLEEFADELNVGVSSLKAWGVCQSFITGEWLIPGHNRQKKLANLYRWVEGRPLCTPLQSVHPFGVSSLPKDYDSIWLCEGFKDGIRHYDSLCQISKRGGKFVRTANPAKSLAAYTGVIALPGSSSLSGDWKQFCHNRTTVNICFDNDHPTKLGLKAGWDGQQKCAMELAGEKNSPNTIMHMNWGQDGYDPELADGYDVSDFYNDHGTVGGFRIISGYMDVVDLEDVEFQKERSKQRDDTPTLEPIERTSYSKLCKDWATHMHFTEEMKNTLACMLAVCVSTTIDGDQLWMRIIGPPGSGKTSLAEAIACAKEHVFSTSIFTGFHSGHKEKGKDDDVSLVPIMQNRTFIVKDADTLLTASNRDRILAELRDLYDRTSRAQYRNAKSHIYEDISTTVLLCGTSSLRKLNRSNLGDRFLDVNILGKNTDTDAFVEMASRNTYRKMAQSLGKAAQEDESEDGEFHASTFLKQVTMGYLYWLKDQKHEIPELSEDMFTKLEGLGHSLSVLRTDFENDEDPEPELPTRLASQFVKLAVCLALVLNKSKVDNVVFHICKKVMQDTVPGRRMRIANLLFKKPSTAEQISATTSIPVTSVRKTLRDLDQLDVVKKVSRPNNSGVRGRNIHQWHLTAEFKNVFTTIISRKKRR